MDNIRKITKQAYDYIDLLLGTRLSVKDQTFFIKRLSFMMKAGVPLEESLCMIRQQTSKKGYALVLDNVIADISNGHRLSVSLLRYKKTFGDFTINIISFGEDSGLLPQNLEYIAEELDKKCLLRKKIISALLYPCIITIATTGVLIFLMVFLFPKILPIFSSLNYSLPFSTRIIIAVSNFTVSYGLIALISITFISFLLIIYKKKNSNFSKYVDGLLLNTPIIRNIVIKYNMANFTRTLGLLLQSGLTMSEALPVCASVTSNLIYKNELRKLKDAVERGLKISTYLHKHKKIFPDVVTHIISVGEHSGNLSDSLMYLSGMYENEIDDITKNLSNMVEPVLMICMGLLIGFIAISIITPIYGITQHLQPK